MREFTVKKGVMGYVVIIGCQVAGFSNKDDLTGAIREYITDPKGMEERLYSQEVLRVPAARLPVDDCIASDVQAGPANAVPTQNKY